MVTISIATIEKASTVELVKLADNSLAVVASKRLADFKIIGEGLSAELPNYSAVILNNFAALLNSSAVLPNYSAVILNNSAVLLNSSAALPNYSATPTCFCLPFQDFVMALELLVYSWGLLNQKQK